MSNDRIEPPDAIRQIEFRQLLVGFRKTVLIDALLDAVRGINLDELNAQIAQFVPSEARAVLAGAGIRDEHVFPTPVLLTAAPQLLGYYRLLMGSPQKSFYGVGTGLSRFKCMEETGTLRPNHIELLPELCRALAVSLSKLICDLDPVVTDRDVKELPLLTLGSFLQGARNNLIGAQATAQVFLSVKSLVVDFLISETDKGLLVQKSANRSVRIHLAADPDIRIEELSGKDWHPKVAVEIKGGADKSNAHNRAGEAEKSHQKAKKKAFPEFWTIISKHGLDFGRLRGGSPTTTRWFDVSQVLNRSGDDWEQFRHQLAMALGIPVAGTAKTKHRRPG